MCSCHPSLKAWQPAMPGLGTMVARSCACLVWPCPS